MDKEWLGERDIKEREKGILGKENGREREKEGEMEKLVICEENVLISIK